MLIACAGERSLGLMTDQLLGVADWACRHHRTPTVHVRAGGRTAPLVALLAAALEPKRFAGIDTYASLDTLDHLVDWPVAYGDNAELFTFGLLAEVDVPDLIRLSEPVPIRDGGRGPMR
jgi:hypothetical protein